MNNHQRGVYQPLMDNVPVYDLSDDEIEEEERSRLPLLIVIALLVLAAFAGVVWLAYNQGVARGRAGAAVVVAAPEGPVRTAPSDAGGSTPFAGLKVYDQPVPADEEARASTLAPVVAEPAVSTEITPASTTTAPAIRQSQEAAPVRSAPAPAPATPTAAAPPPAKPAVAAAPPPAPRPAAPAASAPAPSPTSAAASGGAVLQIGAYESEDIANGAWNAFRNRYANVAGTLAQDIQRADLGARGVWYRLRVGPFADRAAAAAACEALKAQGGTCFVSAP